MPPLEFLRKMNQLNDCVSRTSVKLSCYLNVTSAGQSCHILRKFRNKVLEFCIRIKDTLREHRALYGRVSFSTYFAWLFSSVYGHFQLGANVFNLAT